MIYNNVLLIDDDLDDREFFMDAISELKKTLVCNTFSNGMNALRQLTGQGLIVCPDIIFLDLNMPGISGMEFLAKIKNNTQLKNIPVIVFSTTSDAITIDETKKMGAINFITKPNSYADLVKMLELVLMQE